ncbi:MAG: hypothetical protein QOJ91_1449 [Sphingomonadales bacterium]|jgi:hypothetical protein|nr:hypothetical protein [Sphingomonadales bacterium]
MSLTLDDLFASPDHYLQSYEGDSAIFVPMDRTAYHRSIFLDHRISPSGNGSMRLPLTALAGKAPRPAATGWIFHVAHCGSTLLSRALDDPSLNLVLREPLALRQQAFQPDRTRLALTTALLSKRYREDLPTIVKANVPVNFLLPDLAALDPQARAIFLYSPLDDYLLAILRSENHRGWLQRVTAQLDAYLGDLSGLSDAERCAALWLAQMQAFAGAIALMPNARALNAEAFFDAPRPVLQAAAAHLGVPMSEAMVDSAVSGPLFATYSKNPELPFDNRTRLARRAELEQPLAPELALARRWIEARTGDSAPPDAALVAAPLAA